LFNDAAIGIEVDPAILIEYYSRVTGRHVSNDLEKLNNFPDTGFHCISPKSGDKIIIDCGPIGPDYQPGHAHCDTLSFELSLKGKRIIVDSGCARYEDSDIRKYNRGNTGHNNLTIDGYNQSEVWGAHRCARRAYPLYSELKENNDGSFVFRGAHDGYKRLKGKPIHHRCILWAGNAIYIEDQVSGEGVHNVELRLHINPELKINSEGEVVTVCDDSTIIAHISMPIGGQFEISQGWYCPEFGIIKPCPVLRCVFPNVGLPFNSKIKIEIAE
jgi:uncharacterized heparinase superfamily protein